MLDGPEKGGKEGKEMRSKLCILGIIGFMVTCLCSGAFAQDADSSLSEVRNPSLHGIVTETREEAKPLLENLGLELSADLNISNIYMWRGIMLDGDPVMQPGFYLATHSYPWGKLKAGVWMSHDMSNRDALKSSETDYILDYTYTYKDVGISLGHIYYDFPDALPADGAAKGWSREVYTGISFPKLFLSPSVYYYYDYGKKEDGGGEGSYTMLSVSRSIALDMIKKVACSLDLSGHIGLNNKQYYRGKGGDAAFGIGVTLPLTKNVSMKPNINYSIPWGNISDKGNGNQKARFYSGVYLSCAF